MAADEHAIGSGVIVDSDGYIMRNTHVDEGAQSIQVAQEFRSSASGLQTGDIIHSVNQTSVDSLTSLPCRNQRDQAARFRRAADRARRRVSVVGV